MSETTHEIAALQVEVRVMRQTMDRMTQAIEKLAAIEERLKRVDDLEPRVRAVELSCAQNADVRKDTESSKAFVYKAVGICAALQFIGLPALGYLLLHSAK